MSLAAIAELLDNAIDEVSNGATYVRLDKIKNAREGSPALLVQDNGGGMSPDNIRQCMSLGYSLKNQKTTIGQYGNGFKTSTMRLGADVIVFTRNRNLKTGKSTQSIGLLSYTFLRKTGHEDTVVPMLDYELDAHLVKPSVLLRTTMDDWLSNLNTIIKWSPYSSEQQLLSQFNDIGWHGTKVIIYNLWLNDDGILELDFDSDEHDIQLRVASKELPKNHTLPSLLSNEHISNRYQLSLRAYASILYLKLPEHFKIILRGQPVEHYDIAEDLKFKEYIIYRPQIGPSKEASVTTTIGFSKEAPMINVHGFCVYHRNRLIMPFWKVFQENSSRGRGVIGVLEANFMEPAHDKQDFERTSVFLRLEGRLKAMTIEYWNLHSHLIGYKKTIRPKQTAPQPLDTSRPNTTSSAPLVTATEPSPTSSSSSGQPRASGPSTPPRAGVETIDADGTLQPSGNGAATPLTSVERIAVGNPLPEKVKVEKGSRNPPSKRSRDQEDSLVEASKRQRSSSEAVPLASRGAGDIIASTPDNGAFVVLEQQNAILRQKCAEYELRERHWEQKLLMLEQREKDWEVKVSTLEREVEEQKSKYVMLMSQMKSLSATEAQASKRNGVLAATTGVIKSERS
uniref:HTH merR-type domain-containing protein n=1 Tax=Physcomitrium patens TaxID=3218 RepID=A0A7I4CVD8_PHYPA